MSTKVLASIVVCASLSLAAVGCSSEVVVRTAPPPEKVEVIGVAPSAEHFWIKGHWVWEGAAYVWRPGHWEVRRVGFVWQEPHWIERGGGWIHVEGRWIGR